MSANSWAIAPEDQWGILAQNPHQTRALLNPKICGDRLKKTPQDRSEEAAQSSDRQGELEGLLDFRYPNKPMSPSQLRGLRSLA